MVYTKYVDVVILMFRTFRSPAWTEADLEDLSKDITDFKKLTFQTLAAYKVSRLGTQKWRCLDHVCECIPQVGGVKCCMGVYLRVFTDGSKPFRPKSKEKPLVNCKKHLHGKKIYL